LRPFIPVDARVNPEFLVSEVLISCVFDFGFAFSFSAWRAKLQKL